MNEIILKTLIDFIIGFLIGIGTRIKWVTYVLFGILFSIIFIIFIYNSGAGSTVISEAMNSTLNLGILWTFAIMLGGMSIGKKFINKVMEKKK